MKKMDQELRFEAVEQLQKLRDASKDSLTCDAYDYAIDLALFGEKRTVNEYLFNNVVRNARTHIQRQKVKLGTVCTQSDVCNDDHYDVISSQACQGLTPEEHLLQGESIDLLKGICDKHSNDYCLVLESWLNQLSVQETADQTGFLIDRVKYIRRKIKRLASANIPM